MLSIKCKIITAMIAVFIIAVSATAEVVVPRLSPVPADTAGRKVDLNGEWRFATVPESRKVPDFSEVADAPVIEVPGEWVMQGFEVKKGDRAVYGRRFDVPAGWGGQRVKLRCNGIFSESEIYVNGKQVRTHTGGFTPFETDVTEYVHPGGTNEIVVAVKSDGAAASASNASNYAAHDIGGILRDIYLFILPVENLAMFHVSTDFDTTYTDATLKADIEVANEGERTLNDGQLRLSLFSPQGIRVAEKMVTLPAISGGAIHALNVVMPVKAPAKWDPEHPNLYRLECSVEKDGRPVMTAQRRVGFRKIKTEGNQVLVNGHAVKLRGVCRHEVMPLRGRSLEGDIWRQDVDMFRRGNVNYIRTSHYPPDEALLDACDELGMFVEVEAPLCWAHQTAVSDEDHYDVLVNQHIEMVNRDRSHPSVLMWSMGNESLNFREYFLKAAETVAEMDPTRPRIFSQWGPDADEGMLEIGNHHYPGPGGPDIYRNASRPIVFDEYCHLNAYNRLELSADPGLRNMWGPILDRMFSDMYHSKGVLGGAIWVGIDDTFFLPGETERAVGYGTWGTIDGWRREKPEYWGMKKAYSPVRLSLAGNGGDDGRIALWVENRHMTADLSECVLKWKAGDRDGEQRFSMAPGKSGALTLDIPSGTDLSEGIDISVIGSRGFEIDRYHFRPIPSVADIPDNTNGGRRKLKISRERSDISVSSDQAGVWKVDVATGGLRYIAGGEELLNFSPSLMVLPLNGEGEGIQMVGKGQTFTPYNPVCAHWVAERIEAGQSQPAVRVTGRYDEAEGEYVYNFLPDGTVEVSYDFHMKCDVSPRQVGIVFDMPGRFDNMSWRRKGYWNYYPADHIGALEGSARAFDGTRPVSGLAGPSTEPTTAWAYDQTASGSNMFRSTKENIYEAKLSDGNARGVTVHSDGSQHFRSWIDGDRVKFLVAEYVNGGSDTYLSSHAAKGYRPLKAGDRITGKVRLGL